MEDYVASIASSLQTLEKCLMKIFGSEPIPQYETLLDSQGVTAVLIPCRQYPFGFYILSLAYRRELPEEDDWIWFKTLETFEKRDDAILRAASFYNEHKKKHLKNTLPF